MLTPTTVAVIGVAALVIFGPKKLPELARALGKSLSEFRAGADEAKQVLQAELEAPARSEAKPEARSETPPHA